MDDTWPLRAVWPLVVILGPTASGKSALGIHLAQQLNGEVLACDSTQVYRYFDIGTGKLPAAERCGVPHHLIDFVEPEELFTAGDYQRRARAVLSAVRARGRLPIVTAGTGLYLRALLEGLSPLPPRSPELRARLQERAQERGSRYLHRLLTRVDPGSAAAIAPRDTPKLIRALEVYFSAPGVPKLRDASGGHQPRAGTSGGRGARGRRTRSELFAEGRARLEGYVVVKVGLMPARAELYARIEERVEKMLAAGWLEETRRLRERFPAYAEASGGGPATPKPFGFIGYRQLAPLCGAALAYVGPLIPQAHPGRPAGLGIKEAIKQIKHETRQLAKRQITWFRKEPGVKWFAGFGDEPVVQSGVTEFVREKMGGTLWQTDTAEGHRRG